MTSRAARRRASAEVDSAGMFGRCAGLTLEGQADVCLASSRAGTRCTCLVLGCCWLPLHMVRVGPWIGDFSI